MKGNSKLLIGLLIGAAAGAAISVFLSSEKGKEIIDEIKDATGKAEKDFRKAVDRFENKLSKGKDFAMDMEKKAGKFFKQRIH